MWMWFHLCTTWFHPPNYHVVTTGSILVFLNVECVTLESPLTYSGFVAGLIFTWWWHWHHHRCLCYTIFWGPYPRGKCSTKTRVTSSTSCHWLPRIQTNIARDCTCYLLSVKLYHNHGHNLIANLNDTKSSKLHVFIEALQNTLSLSILRATLY